LIIEQEYKIVCAFIQSIHKKNKRTISPQEKFGLMI